MSANDEPASSNPAANDEPASDSAARRGFIAIFVAAVLAVIIGALCIAFVQFWPKSEGQRQRDSFDACRTAVEDRVSTKGAKRWSTAWSYTVHGDGSIIEGRYDAAEGEAGIFVCVVDGDGNVSGLTVRPPYPSQSMLVGGSASDRTAYARR